MSRPHLISTILARSLSADVTLLKCVDRTSWWAYWVLLRKVLLSWGQRAFFFQSFAQPSAALWYCLLRNGVSVSLIKQLCRRAPSLFRACRQPLSFWREYTAATKKQSKASVPWSLHTIIIPTGETATIIIPFLLVASSECSLIINFEFNLSCKWSSLWKVFIRYIPHCSLCCQPRVLFFRIVTGNTVKFFLKSAFLLGHCMIFAPRFHLPLSAPRNRPTSYWGYELDGVRSIFCGLLCQLAREFGFESTSDGSLSDAISSLVLL